MSGYVTEMTHLGHTFFCGLSIMIPLQSDSSFRLPAIHRTRFLH